MVHFSYCFSLTLLHSFWQAGFLYLLFILFNTVFNNHKPLVKRNIIFLLLLTQVLLSTSTFILCFSGNNSFSSNELMIGLADQLFSRHLFENFAPWIFATYFIILAGKTYRLAFNWFRFKTESRASWTKPSIDLKLFTYVKSHEFGIRRKVTLWFSDHIKTPMTYGFFRPVILLPVALLNNLSVDETETLIIHELTHIRNNDYLLNWVLLSCESLYFFNPFIWLLGNRIRLERELNCDSQVLQFEYPATGYAETLFKAALFKKEHAPFFLAAVVRNNQLFKRIHFFTEEKNLLFSKRNYTGLLVAPIIFLFMMNSILQDGFNQKEPVPGPLSFSLPENGNDGMNTSFYNNVLNTSMASDERAGTATSPVSSSWHQKGSTEAKSNLNVPEQEIQEINDETEPGIIAIPAAVTEAADTKEIIFKEESSETGKSITKVYKMKFVNGEWKFELLLTIAESKAIPDSSNVIPIDTSGYFNPVQ